VGSHYKAALKVGDLIQSLLTYYVISVALHEWFHVMAGYIFGVKLTVVYKPDLTGFCKWVTWTTDPTALFVIGMAGGMGVAATYMVAYLFERDPEDRIAFLIIAPGHALYAVAEGFHLLGKCDLTVMQLMAIAGFALGTVIAVLKEVPRSGEQSSENT